jgi:hypothetical protein
MSFSAVIGHRLLHHQEAVENYSEDNKADRKDAEAKDGKPMEHDTLRYSQDNTIRVRKKPQPYRSQTIYRSRVIRTHHLIVFY